MSRKYTAKGGKKNPMDPKIVIRDETDTEVDAIAEVTVAAFEAGG